MIHRTSIVHLPHEWIDAQPISIPLVLRGQADHGSTNYRNPSGKSGFNGFYRYGHIQANEQQENFYLNQLLRRSPAFRAQSQETPGVRRYELCALRCAGTQKFSQGFSSSMNCSLMLENGDGDDLAYVSSRVREEFASGRPRVNRAGDSPALSGPMSRKGRDSTRRGITAARR